MVKSPQFIFYQPSNDSLENVAEIFLVVSYNSYIVWEIDSLATKDINTKGLHHQIANI